MKIVLGEPKAISNFVESAIEFPLKLSYNDFECMLSLEGLLLAQDGKVLAKLSESILESIEERTKAVGSIAAHETAKNGNLKREKEHITSLIAFLSKGALNHIDAVRSKNPKRDAIFKLRVSVRTLVSRASISHLHEIKRADIDLSSLRDLLERKNIEFLTGYKYDGAYSGPRNNLWLISGDKAPTFLEIRDVAQEFPIQIPASDWIHDFAPQLGIGRFVIAEFPLLSPVAVSAEFAARLNEAIKALPEMEEKVKECEWNEVIGKSRPVAELLRHEDMISSILSKHGYTEEAANSLLNAIKGLFEYSSKFIHRVDKDGRTIPPETKAEKEDAYLIHSLSIGLVNLLAQKVRKSES
jgi:hypothetical protein